MRATDREGIEVNYCPQCGGIWLQRGALEAIISRISAAPGRGQQPTQGREPDGRENDDDEDRSPVWNGRQRRSDDQEGRGGGLRDFLGNFFDLG
jgi:hypothetical protein